MKILSHHFKTHYPIECILTLGLISTLIMAATPVKKPARRPIPAENVGEAQFRTKVQPLLKTYCYPCHSGDVKLGNVAFDKVKSYTALRQDRRLFQKVLKNLRSGTMPPPGMDQPTAVETLSIEQWIKSHVYRIDPANPDPGRVTVRRLNRVEYRNTVRDLIGVDYDTQTEFPPDDTGHGFDNMGDALTVSPMLLEKYLDAAQAVIGKAVPTTSKVVAETEIIGKTFLPEGGKPPVEVAGDFRPVSYYEPATLSHTLQIEHPGDYQIVLDLSAHEKYVDNVFDYNKCRLIFKIDDTEVLQKDFNREGGKRFRFVFARKWQTKAHKLGFELQPLTPGVEPVRALTLRINKVTLRGPFEAKHEVEPRNYRTFFPKPVPTGGAERREYAREVLGDFARRAFRRPIDDKDLSRLVALAEGIYTQPRQTFEGGVAQAMVAVLASPRFLFREEGVVADQNNRPYDLIDEYALASRLSYFLWSSMPDDELFRLAGQGQLRKNLAPQVQRMLRDPRSEALIQNFSGQWLQTRDIANVAINVRAVLDREVDPATLPKPGTEVRRSRPRVQFDEPLRKALRSEADLYFGHIVREDRSVLELINSNYTFLNARLATYYGLADLGVEGDEFRKVTLPVGSPRGGVLTMASVLAVTSNPTRTSPVKRGLFILDNIVGAPAPPPPPDIPPLEDAALGLKDRKPTLREVLSAHRDKPACISCHRRLDPPGLALENFNALGLWRDREYGQPIEAKGTLISGESFQDIRGLKQILVSRHSTEFYRCLTEKLMTYALGRGLEDYDVESVDRVVQKMQNNDGRFSALLTGVIESAPFQKSRKPSATRVAQTAQPVQPLPKGTTAPKNRSHSGEGSVSHER